MSQKKSKLTNKFLKVKKLDNMVIDDGQPRNLAKEVKRFYHALPTANKAGFSQSLKENNATANRTHS